MLFSNLDDIGVVFKVLPYRDGIRVRIRARQDRQTDKTASLSPKY